MASGLGVGLVGFGTIGSGVVRLMQEHAELIDERLGFPLELRRIADLDLETDRGVSIDGYATSKRWQDVIDDPAVDVVVELVGGTGVALEVVRAALERGKRLVTANKALLAHHGAEIYEAADANGTEIAFEASVGGTIPVLRALREGLCADRIDALYGIVNGTCNYVLSEMEAQGEPYEACVKRAQDLGFAEADPTFDVNGMDSTHKLVILLGLGLGVRVAPDSIPTEGIESISALDVEYARSFGFRIKLLALAKLSDAGVEARVQPAMVPASSVLAGIGGAMNAVEVHGRMSGPTLYCGAGAGSLPTASAVVADVMELARGRRLGVAGRVQPLGTPRLHERPVLREEDLEGEYYLRFLAPDRPGVLAEITGALGAQGISIASVVQQERRPAENVPIVIVTHSAKGAAVRTACAQLSRGGALSASARVIRIERGVG